MESSRVSVISSYTEQEIEHPRCAKCDVPMWLTRIEPDFPQHDKRTFECKACGGTTTIVVKYA
jgi:hypothetical protein